MSSNSQHNYVLVVLAVYYTTAEDV